MVATPPSIGSTFWQLLRFSLVGCLNTAVDLLALNALFWLFPTRNIGLLLMENSLAYSVGAVNSFLLNKYWTFRCAGRAGPREVERFALTTLAGVACNNPNIKDYQTESTDRKHSLNIQTDIDQRMPTISDPVGWTYPSSQIRPQHALSEHR